MCEQTPFPDGMNSGRAIVNRPSILLISSPVPCRHGTGAEVRAFFLLGAACTIGDVTLVCSKVPSLRQKNELDCLCCRVICPSSLHVSQPQARTRLRSWAESVACVFSPWRQKMRPWLSLCARFTLCGDLRGYRRIFGWILLIQQWLFSRLRNVPPMAVYWKESAFASVLDELEKAVAARPSGFDLVWLETTLSYSCLSQLMSRVPCNAPVVLSAHNVEWMIPRRQSVDIQDRLLRWATRLQANLMRCFERRAHQASTLAIHCSPQDAELAKEFSSATRIACVGNGVDIDHYKASRGKTSKFPSVIYTGNFDYQPNYDAAVRLALEVLPQIRAKVPDTELLIVGRNASRLAAQLPADCPWLRLISDPEDMHPFLDQAWITVIPLRAGSGTRLKILEAMAMEVAIVCTSIGAEGLGAEDGDVLLIRDCSASQADAAVRLLEDSNARLAIAHRASAWVRQNFSWDQLVQKAVREVRSVVGLE